MNLFAIFNIVNTLFLSLLLRSKYVSAPSIVVRLQDGDSHQHKNKQTSPVFRLKVGDSHQHNNKQSTKKIQINL
jgi:hypothetical protein